MFFLMMLVFVSWHIVAIAQNKPHQKVFVRSIVFKGNIVTKYQIIEREMSFSVGDSLLSTEVEAELEYNAQRILNLQLFSKVNYCINHWENNILDIQYDVSEILYWLPAPIFSLADRNFNVWWLEENRDLSRTNIGMELTRINFRGRNERINVLAQAGYNKLFSISYKIPYIDKGMKHGLSFGLSYATGREINYQTDSNRILFYTNDKYPYQHIQARVGTSFRKAYVAVHDLQLSYHNYTITDELFAQNPDFLGGRKKINYAELMYNYHYNNTNVRVYPTKGVEFRMNVSKKGLGFDKDVNQFIIYNETSFYQRISRTLSSAFVFRGRLAFDAKQPYLLNRAMGFKTEYVRGYEYYVIDGSHYALLRANLRYKIIDKVITQNIVNIMKYIPFRVYVKAYDDVGYVYSKNSGNSFLNNRFLNGYGVGIDIVASYYAKFRIEYSFNHLNKNGLFLHGSKE